MKRRKSSRKAPYSIAALLVAAVIAAGQLLLPQKSSPPPAPVAGDQVAGEVYRVSHVYDGDTLKLDNGERVRMIGIDTPESRDNIKLRRDVDKRRISMETQLKMGKKAGAYTRALVAGQQVRLEYDVEKRDRYQRILAYVYLMDGTFVNEKIIREGYAYPLTVPPNVRYADKFQQWFEEAREQKRGLWQ